MLFSLDTEPRALRSLQGEGTFTGLGPEVEILFVKYPLQFTLEKKEFTLKTLMIFRSVYIHMHQVLLLLSESVNLVQHIKICNS